MERNSDERLAFEVSDLMRLLPINRAAAYRLARELGIRVGRRKIVVPKARFEKWLAESHVEGASHQGVRS